MQKKGLMTMKKFDIPVTVGLRDRDTDKLVAVYPKAVQGSIEEIKDEVFFWYYQQGCSAEEELRNLYIDTLTESEFKMHKSDIKEGNSRHKQ